MLHFLRWCWENAGQKSKEPLSPSGLTGCPASLGVEEVTVREFNFMTQSFISSVIMKLISANENNIPDSN